MTVNVGTMQLPVPEDPDAVRTYLNGTHVSGGLWTALTRSSNHDHSGGTSGIQLTATSIPDGSITTAKLDPAVLGPYALTDGSKPFTGTVTMSADTLVRDTLRFGAKPAGVADATLARTGAGALRLDTHLGVGGNVPAWSANSRTIQVGAGAILGTDTGAPLRLDLNANTYHDGTSRKAISVGAAGLLRIEGSALSFDNAPSVAAGAAQTFTTRLALAPTGTLTLTPDAGQWGQFINAPAVASNSFGLTVNAGTNGSDTALQVNNAGGSKTFLRVAGTGTLTLTPDAGVTGIAFGSAAAPAISHPTNIALAPAGNIVHPATDNVMALGAPSVRWATCYVTAGVTTGSSADLKEGITPLDPAACYQAAKDVVWYEFAYLPPAYTEPEPPPNIAYDAADDNDTKAEKKARRDEAEAQAKAAHLKMVAETAPARHQRGFVFPDGPQARDEAGGALPPVPDLFGLSDRESTTPQADLATLGCALQEVIRRLETLEGAAA